MYNNLIRHIKSDYVSFTKKYDRNFDEGLAQATSLIWIIPYYLVPTFAVVVNYRVYSYLCKKQSSILRFFGKIIYHRTSKKYNCDIHPLATIGAPFKVGHPFSIVIGPDVVIGKNCYLFDGVSLGNKYVGAKDEMPKVGDSVIVGTGSKLLGNVKIGDHSTIGALSLILTDVESHTVAKGIPYRPQG
jgi:serine O-acetyltransferase